MNKQQEVKPCDHGNTMGLHGQVVCVWCGAVIRQMTPEERATDWTFRGVVDPKAAAFCREVTRKQGEEQ